MSPGALSIASSYRLKYCSSTMLPSCQRSLLSTQLIDCFYDFLKKWLQCYSYIIILLPGSAARETCGRYSAPRRP
jgi:hypothetical protein